MKPRVIRIAQTIPRVIILAPLVALIKIGELAEKAYDTLSPHLPGYDT
jgi:hypothetical protein